MTLLQRVIPLSILFMSLMNCATASELQMTGAEIKARVIGHTIIGVEGGKPYREYYSPDGTLKGNDSSGFYGGYWRIEGDKLCFAYESDAVEPTKGWDCSQVGLIGDRLIWNDDGQLSEGKLVTGQQ